MGCGNAGIHSPPEPSLRELHDGRLGGPVKSFALERPSSNSLFRHCKTERFYPIGSYTSSAWHEHFPIFKSAPHTGHRPLHSSEHSILSGVASTTASLPRPARSSTTPSTNGLDSDSDSGQPSAAVGTNSRCSASTSTQTSLRQREQGPHTVAQRFRSTRNPPAMRSTLSVTPCGTTMSYRVPPILSGANSKGYVDTRRCPLRRPRSWRFSRMPSAPTTHARRERLYMRSVFCETVLILPDCPVWSRSRPRCTAARNRSRLVSSVFNISSA